MERRGFFRFGIVALAAGIVSMFMGCSKTESAPKLHNQEKLWTITAAAETVNEPIELAYAKGTPASYRDASLGKEDPNFKPKTGGG